MTQYFEQTKLKGHHMIKDNVIELKRPETKFSIDKFVSVGKHKFGEK